MRVQSAALKYEREGSSKISTQRSFFRRPRFRIAPHYLVNDICRRRPTDERILASYLYHRWMRTLANTRSKRNARREFVCYRLQWSEERFREIFDGEDFAEGHSPVPFRGRTKAVLLQEIFGFMVVHVFVRTFDGLFALIQHIAIAAKNEILLRHPYQDPTPSHPSIIFHPWHGITCQPFAPCLLVTAWRT